MTDAELLEVARKVLPARLQTASMRVLRAGDPTLFALQDEGGHSLDKQLWEELEAILNFKLPANDKSELAEVVAVETTSFGTRATVVHIRNGIAVRILSQA